MELVKDKSKRIQWLGAHRGWGPRMGFSKMVQRVGVLVTSRAAGQGRMSTRRDIGRSWRDQAVAVSKVEEVGTGK